MARVNLGQSPYFDDYDASKQYYQLLAIPGRVAQAREFTQMQTTLREIIKSIGDSILRNGDIIEGCQVLVNGTQVTVTEGRVYVDGIVMPTNGTYNPETQKDEPITIRGTGTESIGVKLMELIIDERSDETLRDPAQGYDNYNQPGCTRLKRWLEVVANDPDSATIATIVDGEIMVESYAPDYDVLTQTLARRTYDESGSYIVEGLKSRVEHYSDNQYAVVVEPGKAYVLGYELKIPTARRKLTDKSTTYGTVTMRDRTYLSTNSYYKIDDDPHVKSIVRVTGDRSKEIQQTAPNNTAAVLIPYENSVVRVTSVGNGKYKCWEGKIFPGDPIPDSSLYDCYLYEADGNFFLKWNGSNNYPGSDGGGTDYSLVYESTIDFTQGTDYELVLRDGGHWLHWIDGGNTPIPGTRFDTVYEQYFARKDIVYMDKYGVIDVVKGVPARYGFEVLPEAPLNTLTLAYVDNPPNGSAVISEDASLISVRNVGLKRFTMNDIQDLLNRLQTIEYDQALISLQDDARQVVTSSDKKGIFTDPLVDLSHLSVNYNLNNDGSKNDENLPIYDMALDLACNICYLPIVSNTHEPKMDPDSTANRYNRLISLRVTGEQVPLSQLNATKSFPVNPYTMFPQMPEVTVDPAVDNWIEDTIIQVPVSLTDSAIVSMSTRTIDNTTAWKNSNRNYSRRSTTSVSDTAIGTRTEVYTSDSVVSQNAITYIRKRTLTVEGRDFPPALDNIKCYFDGIEVPLVPSEIKYKGTEAGSVLADDSGYFKATFTIPEGILTGTREVLLKSNIPVDNMISEGFTLYTAYGTSRQIERTVTTVTTVLLERVTTTTIQNIYVDPVGQTFVLDKMSLIKGIDLYFESKSDSASIVCEIREVNNGSITSTVYAHKSLSAAEVKVDPKAQVATRFNFDDPVLLEENKEYAFVVRSLSDAYRLWVAELGGVEISTKDTPNEQIVLKNAYMTGVMLSSSNNSTWTAHQNMDVKFRLVEDTYERTSELRFDTIPVEDAARLYLTADAAIPAGTKVDWSYTTDVTNPNAVYTSITPYNIELLGGIYGEIKMRAILTRDDSTKLSPLVALDTIYLVVSNYEQEGCYISRQVSGLDSYTRAKIIVDMYEPTNSPQFEVSVMGSDGKLKVATRDESKFTALNYDWVERVYDVELDPMSGGLSHREFRVFIKATSPNKYSTPAFRRLRCIMS